MAEINENILNPMGVEVERSSVRVYNDVRSISPQSSGTGKVQEDQLAELNEEWRQSEEAKDHGRRMLRTNDLKRRRGGPDRYREILELEAAGEGLAHAYVDNMWDAQGGHRSRRTPRPERYLSDHRDLTDQTC